MKNAAKLFKALGDDTRLGIISLLLGGKRCVCEIFPDVKRAQSTVSIQLSKLEAWGLISSSREGKNIYYKIKDKRLSGLCALAGLGKPVRKKSKCLGKC